MLGWNLHVCCRKMWVCVCGCIVYGCMSVVAATAFIVLSRNFAIENSYMRLTEYTIHQTQNTKSNKSSEKA